MSSIDIVKEAREALKNKKKSIPINTKYSPPFGEHEYEHEYDEEQFDEYLSYEITINVKVKKNGKNVPAKTDILNWCGNILTATKA